MTELPITHKARLEAVGESSSAHAADSTGACPGMHVMGLPTWVSVHAVEWGATTTTREGASDGKRDTAHLLQCGQAFSDQREG
ncbi:MAG: hypothetical protein A3G82_13735 [Burkholderiales bacterium RIFCSPLOWO2_12_FULL_67_210]|nr:MAG: hypothetical protein A3G82_13735 [Burkholderiales bacterium RIFCSPLOWO2_12_FULL_67_210]